MDLSLRPCYNCVSVLKNIPGGRKIQMEDRTTRKRRARALDALCVAGVLLIPLFLGGFFVMLIQQGAAPVWYLVIHGLLLAASLGALIWFIAIGLFRAIFKKRSSKRKGGEAA